MSMNLVLKPSCGGCGSAGELYGTTCRHLTLCGSCAKTMAENGSNCYECGTPIINGLIYEYNVRSCPNNDKNHFIGRFVSGVPNLSKKRSENKWFLQKEGLQGRQLTDTLREKYKNKAWMLEDEIGTQLHGQPEGAQSAIYYLLVTQGKEFVATPAGSWYTFNKVAQYKQLTLEEAEEKMKNRRKTADGYQRWMMKAANNGAAAFGEVDKYDEKEVGGSGSGKGKKKTGTDDDEGRASDQGEEDGDEESARKSRLRLNKKSGGDDEEGPRGGDLDMDDDDIEKGDDWEHEEIFTDDDEAVGDAEEREDLAPEIPAPPEIKQDEEDEEEGDEEEGGGLTKSGKELKKLLSRANGLNDSDGDDDDDDDDSDDDVSAVVATNKQKEGVKEEASENISPLKSNTSGSSRGTAVVTSSKSSKGKRKLNGDESKSSNDAAAAPQKKMKSENDVKGGKEENNINTNSGSSKNNNNVHPKSVSSPQSSTKAHAKTVTPQSVTKNQATGPVTEDEIRAMLPPKTQVTTQDLVGKFKSRLKSKEDKDAFAEILKKISKIQTINGKKIIVLREK